MRYFFVTLVLCSVTGMVHAQAGDYQVMDLQASGRLSGRVVFDGRVPAPLQLLITKDMEICGEGYRERVEVDVADAGGLRNVVVFIEDIDAGKPWSAADSTSRVNQEVCAFRPHIQVIPRGREVDIINSDSTLHNIHAYELIGRARRSLFNVSQPEAGVMPQVLDPRRGSQVSLECDSHDFMQGWIFVADHPYATVVNDSGAFELGEVPSGTYRLSAWHPRLGVVSQEVTVEAGSDTDAEFTFDTD